MFEITTALREHLQKHFGLAADANDEAVRACVHQRLISGELPSAKLAELTGKTKAPDIKGMVKEEVAAAMTTALDPVQKSLAAITEKLGQLGTAPANPGRDGATVAGGAGGDSTPGGDSLDVMTQFARDREKALALGGTPQQDDPTGRVRVKSAIERYSDTRKTAVMPERTMKGNRQYRAGLPAQIEGKSIDEPSELMHALNGVYFKWALQPSLHLLGAECPRWLKMTDHDKDLLNYLFHEVPWVGIIHGEGTDMGGYKVPRVKLDERMRKDLLDDGTSGGTNAVPIFFDDALVLTPVLYGELFPRVEVVNVSRGRLIDGASMSNPTITSGTAEGTPISPFSTTSFISAMDTTIYPAVSAVRIGLDFEEDTPADIGAVMVTKFGEKFMEWLDNQIANGDGSTEMQGLANASGTTTVLADNGTGGPPTVGDYEGLMFAVSKAFRRDKGGRVCFIANDTSYRRARAIAVGPNDERRVFGMDHQSYMLLDHPYLVQNDIGNSSIYYCNLGFYRCYRRLGMTVRVETAGSTLALANEKLIVVRGRFGGRLTLGGACAVMSDAQS